MKKKVERLFIPGSKGSLTYLSAEDALREFWREVRIVKREVSLGMEPDAPWPTIEYGSGDELRVVSGGDRIVECPYCGGIAAYIEDRETLIPGFSNHAYQCIVCGRTMELSDSEEEKMRNPDVAHQGANRET